MSLKPIPKGSLREGYTTGTCATASAKAALRSLLTGEKVDSVDVYLPTKRVVRIKIKSCEVVFSGVECTVVKDAGDDPDVTHGATIGARIRLIKENKIVLKGGKGVGLVTLPGLDLKVGDPAINPVPRKMINSAIKKLLHDFRLTSGVEVEIFVENGEIIAKKTLNERVGIKNGISILGTTGIVKPYSSSSYIASIVQGVEVAEANNVLHLVINSGGKSEKVLKSLFPGHPEHGFVQYGNWIGETLKKISKSKIQKVSLGIMLGKAVKLAEGRTDTHSCVSSWNKDFLKMIAFKSGYDLKTYSKIDDLNMAGRLVELFPFNSSEKIYNEILKNCYQSCFSLLRNQALEIFLVGNNNQTIKYTR